MKNKQRIKVTKTEEGYDSVQVGIELSHWQIFSDLCAELLNPMPVGTELEISVKFTTPAERYSTQWNTGEIPKPTGLQLLFLELLDNRSGVSRFFSYDPKSPDESDYPALGWVWPEIWGTPLDTGKPEWDLEVFTGRWCIQSIALPALTSADAVTSSPSV